MWKIKKYEPLLAIYFNDPIEGTIIFTTELSKKDALFQRMKSDAFVEIESKLLKCYHIYKCEPVTDSNPILYTILSQEFNLRRKLLAGNWSDMVALQAYIEAHKKNKSITESMKSKPKEAFTI